MSVLPSKIKYKDIITARDLSHHSSLTHFVNTFSKSLDPNERYWFRCFDNPEEGLKVPNLSAHRVVRKTTSTNAIWHHDYAKGTRLKRLFLHGSNRSQYRESIPEALDEYYRRKFRQTQMAKETYQSSLQRAKATYEFLTEKELPSTHYTLSSNMVFRANAEDLREIEEEFYQ